MTGNTIEVVLRAKGSGQILNAVQSFDKAAGRSADQAQANAKKSEAALDSHIEAQRRLTRELKTSRDELQNLSKGTDEYKALQARIRELSEEEVDAKATTKQLTNAVSESAVAVEATANNVRGLTLRLNQAKQMSQKADFGSDAAKEAEVHVKQLQEALDRATGKHKEVARAVDVHARSLVQLDKELRDARDEMGRLDTESDAFKRAKSKVDRLTHSLKKANGEVRETGFSMGKMTIAAGAATTGAYAFVAGLESITRAAREASGEVADADLALDSMSRRLQVQAGLTDEGRVSETKKLLEVALERGATAEDAIPLAVQLKSSGFDSDPEIVDEILKTQQATNFSGESKDLVVGIGQLLESYGLDKTLANAQPITTASSGLFKETDFQIVDLQQLAKQGSVLEGANLELETSLAAFGALRETLPAGESATGLRNFVSILQTAGAENAKVEALEKLGITPEEVDLVGESLSDVLERIRIGVQGVSESEANLATGKLFGRENVASAKLLINGRERIAELEGKLTDREQFEEDAETISEGRQATENRREVRGLLRNLGGAGAGAARLVGQEKDANEKFDERRDEVLEGDDTDAVKRTKLAAIEAARAALPASRAAVDILAVTASGLNQLQESAVEGHVRLFSKLPVVGGLFDGGKQEESEETANVVRGRVIERKPEPIQAARVTEKQQPVTSQADQELAKKQVMLLEKLVAQGTAPATPPVAPTIVVRAPDQGRQQPRANPPLAKDLP